MNKLRINLSFFAVLLGASVFAQGNLGNIQLEVTRAFEGQVQQPRKINDLPRINDTIRSEVQLDYQIRPRNVFTNFSPEPLAPARIRRVTADKLPKLMVAIGAGNFFTSMADISFNSDRSRDQSWGMKFRHFSTHTGVPDLVFSEGDNASQFPNFLSENRLSGHYRRFFRNYTLTTRAEGFYDAVNYYGVPLIDGFNNEFIFGDVGRQQYLGTKAEIDFESQRSKSESWFDQGTVSYHYIQDAFGSRENWLNVPTRWSFPVDDILANIDLRTTFLQARSDTNALDAQYLNVHLNPHVEYLRDNLALNIGAHFIFNDNSVVYRGDEEKVNRFIPRPNVTGRLTVVPNVMEVFGGFDYDFRMNNTLDLTREVPWLNPGVLIRPTRKSEGFFGTSFLFMSGLNVELKAQYIFWGDRALIYRDPSFATDVNGLQGLQVRYLDGTELGLNGRIRYQVNDDLRLGMNLAYSRYDNFTYRGGATAPFHLAPWRGGFDAQYMFRKKIGLQAKLVYVGSREAFDPSLLDNNAQNPLGVNPILDAFWDMDMSIDFYFNDNLTAFLRVHNAFASRYDLYLGYGAQRFLTLAGFSFRL